MSRHVRNSSTRRLIAPKWPLLALLFPNESDPAEFVVGYFGLLISDSLIFSRQPDANLFIGIPNKAMLAPSPRMPTMVELDSNKIKMIDAKGS